MNRVIRAAYSPLWAALAAVIAAAFLLSGCSASPAASSLTANPTYSKDASQLEATFAANFTKDHSVKKAVQATFPQGDTAKIEAYATKTFTPAALKPGKTRQAWVNGVIAYAVGTTSPSPSPSVSRSLGAASIPGVPAAPVTKASPKGSAS